VILYLIPVFILGFLLLVMVTMALLSRYKGGKYLRPVFQFLTKIPVLKGLIQKASEKAIARYNPELAGAMKKLQRAGADKDPMRAQQALSTLSADERKAWMDAAGQQGALEQRRAMERMQKGRMPSPQQKRRAK
jgi:hypothetical protein